MGKRLPGELEAFIRANPSMTQAEIAREFGVSRQAVSKKFQTMRARGDAPIPPPPPPPPAVETPGEFPAVIEKTYAEENFLATEQGKAKLAGKIGSKIDMILSSMTPEKADRANFKDLSIAAGVLIDKQRQINDSASSGQGLLAAALIKAVAQQIGHAMKEAMPEPTQVIEAEGVVVDG